MYAYFAKLAYVNLCIVMYMCASRLSNQLRRTLRLAVLNASLRKLAPQRAGAGELRPRALNGCITIVARRHHTPPRRAISPRREGVARQCRDVSAQLYKDAPHV